MKEISQENGDTKPGKRRLETIKKDLLALHAQAETHQEVLGELRQAVHEHIHVVESATVLVTLETVGI